MHVTFSFVFVQDLPQFELLTFAR